MYIDILESIQGEASETDLRSWELMYHLVACFFGLTCCGNVQVAQAFWGDGVCACKGHSCGYPSCCYGWRQWGVEFILYTFIHIFFDLECVCTFLLLWVVSMRWGIYYIYMCVYICHFPFWFICVRSCCYGWHQWGAEFAVCRCMHAHFHIVYVVLQHRPLLQLLYSRRYYSCCNVAICAR